MTKVHFRRHEGRKMAALDVPTYIGAIRVACVGDLFADALGNAAQIALRLADDPVMRAIMPPQATLAIQAVKALSSAAQQGPAALQQQMQQYNGPGAQRVAQTLNKEAKASGNGASVKLTGTTGFYGLPSVGDASASATAKGKTGKAKCHWSPKDKTWHCATSSMIRPKHKPKNDDVDPDDPRYAAPQDNGDDGSQYDDGGQYGGYAPQQQPQQAYAPQQQGYDPYANVDPYTYQYGASAAHDLDAMEGLDPAPDVEPPDYAEQEYAEALDEAAQHGDHDAIRQVLRATQEHNDMLDAADEDNEMAADDCACHEPADHEPGSPQSLPNATRQP